MKTDDRIKQSKENGIKIRCKIIGDGSNDNPWRPKIFDEVKGYFHVDIADFNYSKKECVVWVNKKMSKLTELGKVREKHNDVNDDLNIIDETG